MAQGESYDPRTWREGVDYSRNARVYPPLISERASRIGLALSMAVLLAGGVLAYATRGAPPAGAAARQG